MKPIRVLSAIEKSRTPINNLSFIQNLVCRLFKIEPKLKYRFRVTLTVDGNYYSLGGSINDVLISHDGTKWLVDRVQGEYVDLISFFDSESYFIGDLVLPIYSCFRNA
jgi:hypothetical protein